MAMAVAVIITVALTAQIVNVTQANNTAETFSYAPGVYSQKVLSGQIVLNPEGMFVAGFNVPDEARNAALQGEYSVVDNSTNNSCCVIVWSQQEFLNYFGGKSAVPCYNKDFMPRVSDGVDIALSKGNYIVTINAGSIDSKVLNAELYLNFTV